MKKSLIYFFLGVGLLACQKDIDPRDQYLGPYNVTYESVTVDSLNNRTYTGFSRDILTAEKGQQANQIVFTADQEEVATAILNGSDFVIPKTTMSTSDAAGDLHYYQLEGKGFFNANKLDMTLVSTVKYAMTQNHVTGTRK